MIAAGSRYVWPGERERERGSPLILDYIKSPPMDHPVIDRNSA